MTDLQLYLAEFTIDDVISKLSSKSSSIKLQSSINGLNYKLILLRYTSKPKLKTFIKGTNCVCCGLEGKRFVLMQKQKHIQPSLQLFSEYDNKSVLMTIDHIIPKSKGGINRSSNYQTMCSNCNSIKGNSDISFDEIRSLPKNYPNYIKEYNSRIFWTDIYGEQVFTYIKDISIESQVMYRRKNLDELDSGTLPILVNLVYGNKDIIATDGRWHYRDGELYKYKWQLVAWLSIHWSYSRAY